MVGGKTAGYSWFLSANDISHLIADVVQELDY